MAVIVGQIIEEKPSNRVLFELEGLHHVVFSGRISVNAHGGDDDFFSAHDCQLIVGPWWRGVRQVSPALSVALWNHENSDEDDNSGFIISEIHWDTVGGVGPHAGDERIRILCTVGAKG